MKAQETAVVLIEFQNEFCKDGGKLNPGVNSEIARQGTIENAVKLAQGARDKGAMVIHAPFIFNPSYYAEHQMVGIVKAVADADAFKENTWGAEIIDELKRQGIGIFLIDHDVHQVKRLCDRAAVMKNGALVGTVKVDEVTTDDILAMIIAGKKPEHVAA